MRFPTASLLLLLSTLAGGCTWFKSNPNVLITSEPPGAHVFIDGHDSGKTTPYSFDMAGNFGSNHTIELRRRGYRPAVRELIQHTEWYTFRYVDGAGPAELPPLPLFMTGGDFFFPFGVRGAVIPSEIYVKLYREDEPLLGFDVLAARAAAESMPATAGGGQ